ncbi:MAG: hypothetical protein KAJ14_06435 [Candidatus Omnitrophica bacterium]|nr:hypothetical protein [Cyclobacteriaceae bacterium]MCK5492727.1 hypothetical protein [Candidatus Omnitrophota bacterium]
MIESNKVIFVGDKIENIFNLLPDEDPLKKGIIKAIQDIINNCRVGEVVKKNSVILKNYKDKYKIKNLRVYDLPLAYRLMYTITPSDIEIISVILDWKNHKDYDRMNKRKM